MDYAPPTGGASNDPYVGRTSSTQGSKVPPHAIENPMRELVNLISDSGQTPSPIDLHQVAKAIVSGKLIYGVDTGSADALVVALPRAPDALTNGMILLVRKGPSANATTTPTLLVSPFGAKAIVKRDGSALAIGDLPANGDFLCKVEGSTVRVLSFLTSEVAPAVVAARSTIGSSFFKSQIDPSDLYYDTSADANFQSSPYGTVLGSFTTPTGFVNILLNANFFVSGGTGSNTGLYLAIFTREHGTSTWTRLESQKDTKLAGLVMSISRPAAQVLDPTKSYDFIVHGVKDSATTTATPASGNLIGLGLRI